MTKEDMELCLNRALHDLFDVDGYLLDVDSSERSISHRFAVHLARHLPGFDVDCEYNRDGFDVKRLALDERPTSDNNPEAVTVFPDIIVHRRGTNKHNMLVVEMKKGSSRVRPDYDVKKLKAFRQELNYMFAVHVIVGNDGSGKLVRKLYWVDG